MGFSEHFTRWFNHFGGLPRKHMDRKDHDIFSEVLLINSTYPLSFQTLLITAVTWAQRCPRVPPRVSHGTAPSCPQLPNRGPSWRRHVSAGSSERSKPRCTSKLDHPQAAWWNWWNVSFWVKASKKKSNMKYSIWKLPSIIQWEFFAQSDTFTQSEFFAQYNTFIQYEFFAQFDFFAIWEDIISIYITKQWARP